MKLLDLNVLAYAMDESSSRHQAARDWLDETLSGSDTVGLAWHVLIGFERISTRSAVFAAPLTVSEGLVGTGSIRSRLDVGLLCRNVKAMTCCGAR
jgi:predicted nucleic acid-binding protein